jgi:hypothetical protein
MKRTPYWLPLALLFLTLIPSPLKAASEKNGVPNGPWNVSSPNGSLTVLVEMKDSPEKASLSYRVLHNNGEVLPSAPLGLTLKRLGQFTRNLRFVGQSTGMVNERYTMPVGKRSQCLNNAKELI